MSKPTITGHGKDHCGVAYCKGDKCQGAGAVQVKKEKPTTTEFPKSDLFNDMYMSVAKQHQQNELEIDEDEAYLNGEEESDLEDFSFDEYESADDYFKKNKNWFEENDPESIDPKRLERIGRVGKDGYELYDTRYDGVEYAFEGDNYTVPELLEVFFDYDLNEEHVDQLLKTKNVYTLRHLASSEIVTPEHLLDLSRSDDVEMRNAVAQNDLTPPNLLRYMSKKDKDVVIRKTAKWKLDQLTDFDKKRLSRKLSTNRIIANAKIYEIKGKAGFKGRYS